MSSQVLHEGALTPFQGRGSRTQTEGHRPAWHHTIQSVVSWEGTGLFVQLALCWVVFLQGIYVYLKAASVPRDIKRAGPVTGRDF